MVKVLITYLNIGNLAGPYGVIPEVILKEHISAGSLDTTV